MIALKILRYIFYALIGMVLMSGGIDFKIHWQFWAIMGLVVFVDVISTFIERADNNENPNS